MKAHNLIIVLLLGIIENLQAQPTLLPQTGITNPVGAFAGENTFADRGWQAGLHIDQVWRKFGIGIYGGYANNPSTYQAPIPGDINTDNFRSRIFVEQNGLDWKSYQAAIGPVLQFGKKTNVQLFSKFGGAKQSFPDYRYYLDVSDPVEQEYTLFQTNPERIEVGWRPMLVSGLRVNIGLSENLGVSFSADYTSIWEVTHSYTYLEQNLSQSSTEIEILEILETAPTITELRKCNFNSIGLNVGIIFRFNKKDKIPKEEPFTEVIPEREPIPQTAPETPYLCEQITYSSPGFNDVVIMEENSKIIFRWEDANNAIAEQAVQYELVLFAKLADEYKELYSKTTNKKELKLDLKNVRGIFDNEVFWEVNPIRISTSADTCPFENQKMRVQVFKNEKEAKEKLQECKSE